MLITAVTMKIKNYEKWKLLFDEFIYARKSSGSMGGTILKDHKGTNIQIIMKWSDEDMAKKFHNSDGLQDAMVDAGMIGQPIVHYYYQEGHAQF